MDAPLSNFDDMEQRLIFSLLGRTPNELETAIIAALWSEHCSYKSSKNALATLAFDAEWVICGEGENAGAVDVGDELACVFKIESHNHPSFIEPYQGAATGVGGILRDIFAMNARPKALMNVLAFGAPSHKRSRYLLDGVVRGIADYGNAIGIPNVGGECRFDESYNGNILVNALAAGIGKKSELASAAAKKEGALLLYAGSATGADGLEGAQMASKSFDAEQSSHARPSVQGGDPLAGKQIMEASLEILNKNCALAAQDMGAAGLTSATFEMAAKGKKGVILHLDKIPLRDKNLSPHHIMLSESQERMLFAIEPRHQKQAFAICKKWGVQAAIIGKVIKDEFVKMYWQDELLGSLPTSISADAPRLKRPTQAMPQSHKTHSITHKNAEDILVTMLTHPAGASKKWIYQQYDQDVGIDSVQGAGEDAAIITINEHRRAIALSCDSNPYLCAQDANKGTQLIVSECYRNLCAVGAFPLALTNNLNFGNPEKKHIMASFNEAVEGLRLSSHALRCPVVSGNVSLYNESDGKDILPTPVIGGLGVMNDWQKRACLKNMMEQDFIFLVGETHIELGASLYLRLCHPKLTMDIPQPLLESERKHGAFVRQAIQDGIISCCHDISEGGLLLAACELALASHCGMSITAPHNDSAWLVSESPARYLIATQNEKSLMKLAHKHQVPCVKIGKAQRENLSFEGTFSMPLHALLALYEQWFADYMKENEQQRN